MSAVFAPSSDRSRSEPRPSLADSTVRAINNAHRLGKVEGDRLGYIRGTRWGALAGFLAGCYCGAFGAWAVVTYLTT